MMKLRSVFLILGWIAAPGAILAQVAAGDSSRADDSSHCAMQAPLHPGDRKHFVSTLSLRSLIRAFEERAPGTARVAAERLTYRDFIVVALVMDGANLTVLHAKGSARA